MFNHPSMGFADGMPPNRRQSQQEGPRAQELYEGSHGL